LRIAGAEFQNIGEALLQDGLGDRDRGIRIGHV
jgi:hypothetical protein